MKNLTLLFMTMILLPAFLQGQKNPYIAKGLRPLEEVPRVVMPLLDNEVLLSEEMQRRGPGIAPKFAESIDVDINTETHGIWETASNGNEVWRLRIYSKDAKSLNLGFTKYNMPRGGSLILYTPKRSKIMGPFTPADNEEHEQLWTPVVPGDELIIEVQVPPQEKANLELELKSVNHDFLGFTEMSMLSGSCNLDVICGEADGWGIVDGYRDIIRSVAVIGLNGGTFCTGFLVNNVNNDCTPFFMTANHCGITSGNAASFVAYWNYESPVCRQPNSSESGGNGNGSLADFNTGAIHRASYAPSDMTLIELDDPVSETADAFFAGWSAEYVMPQDTIICIHHPNTDEKRISFEFDPAAPGQGLNGNVVDISIADHVIIPDWDIGTTEPGSSGSPLYNNQKQVVGQLHGGGAACGNDEYDSFGWFYTSWEGGGTPSTALKFWLDPNETGITNIPGHDCSFGVSLDPPFQEVCSPENVVFNIMPTGGFASEVTFTASNLPAGAVAIFGQNPIPPDGSTTLTISTDGVAAGQYTINVEASDGMDMGSSTVVINVLSGEPSSITLSSPDNTATAQSTSPQYAWQMDPLASSYTIEIASDENFTDIIHTATDLQSNSYVGNFLEVLTTYYWRVRATNSCGEGPWSESWSFTTAEVSCGALAAADVPIAISEESGGVMVTSVISIASNQVITSLKVTNFNVPHTWVGDLSATLQSPTGTIVQLFDRPGVDDTGGFGCSNEDIAVSFDDNATLTAQDFEDSCDDNPAIGGVFQSIDPLSTFNGEPANGDWILTIIDHAGNDGGSLDSWSLDLCTIVPLDLSMETSQSSFHICTQDTGELSFSLTLGQDFEGDITLSATDLPVGASVDFSSNPVSPGETVTVTISNLSLIGFSSTLIYATDGTHTNNTAIDIQLSDVPAVSTLMSPNNTATDVSLTPTLEWMAVSDVDNYTLEVATDMSFIDVIINYSSDMTSFPISNPLDYGTTYYWRIITINNCGEANSLTSSFTTILDLSLEVSTSSFDICNDESADFTLNIGQSFASSGATLTATGLPAGANIVYSSNPASPGEEVSVSVSGLDAGDYTLTITADDGSNSNTVMVNLSVEAAPAASALTSPTNGSTGVAVLSSLDWEAVGSTNNYLLEIASDAGFSNILFSSNLSNTDYQFSSPLDYNTTYYWRITTANECGETQSAVYSFTTELNTGVNELEGIAFNIFPNPTSRDIHITFAKAIDSELRIQVFAVDGSLLKERSLGEGVQDIPLRLNYANGVYIIRLVMGSEVVGRRILLQR